MGRPFVERKDFSHEITALQRIRQVVLTSPLLPSADKRDVAKALEIVMMKLMQSDSARQGGKSG